MPPRTGRVMHKRGVYYCTRRPTCKRVRLTPDPQSTGQWSRSVGQQGPHRSIVHGSVGARHCAGEESTTMTGVKRARVLGYVLLWAILCACVLWVLGARLWAHWSAIIVGAVAGSSYAVWHWRQLAGRIARRGRPFEPNKIFVHYLSLVEV